mgnify:CR=1 FL=1
MFILIIGGIVTSLFAVGGVYLGVKLARSIFRKRDRYSRKVTPLQVETNNHSPVSTQRIQITESSPTLQHIDPMSTTNFSTTNTNLIMQNSARRRAFSRIQLMRNGSSSPEF